MIIVVFVHSVEGKKIPYGMTSGLKAGAGVRVSAPAVFLS